MDARQELIDHINREMDDSAAYLAVHLLNQLTPAPSPQSVLGSVDGPEALTPDAEPFREGIGEIGARERRETVNSGLSPLFEDLSSAVVAEHTGVLFHDGLRTGARAHASPSRREVGDEAHVEQMPEKETPPSPEKREVGLS